ncbi:MAG: VWA domain-containing protein, partial [Gemmataceae bacterium]|nr:VWA domain-containing protein [Gemmataceae bacterium]
MAKPIETRPSVLARVWFPVALAGLLLLLLPVLVLVIMHLAEADGSVNAWLDEQFQLRYEFPLPWQLGLLFLLIPALILLLYFLKLKRKPLQVPSTFLWRKSIEDLHVNSLFQWLRENVLLLLQLLAVLLLLYAVMGFRFHGSTAKGQHYILMIDNSASMAATDIKPSRLEWAREQALKVIEAATEDSVGMVIVFNDEAKTLQPPTSDRERLRQAVRGIPQTHRRPTRLIKALVLADARANPSRSTEDVAVRPDDVPAGQERQFVPPKGIPTDLYLFSDGSFADPSGEEVSKLNSLLAGNTSALGNLNLIFQLAGQKGAQHVNNVGILNLTAARLAEKGAPRAAKDAHRLQVLVQVRNYRARDTLVKLRLDVSAEDRLLHTTERVLDLGGTEGKGKDNPAEQAVSFLLPPLDLRSSTVIHAYLEGIPDDFPLDDEARLVVGAVRKANLLLVGPDNPVLDAFFNQEAARQLAKVKRLAPAELENGSYRDAAQSGELDLVIFDRCMVKLEDELPRANTFCIDRPPPPWVRGSKSVKNPVLFPSKKEHPLMRHIHTLWDVGVSDAFRFHVRDNLAESAKDQFNLDGKEPAKRALPPVTRLIEASSDAPVLFTLPRGSFTDLVMTFPLVNDQRDLTTNWSLQPSFPLFLRNVLLVLGNVGDGLGEGTVPPGKQMELRPEAGVKWLEVTPPGGRPERLLPGPRNEFVYANTERVGPYQVRRDDGGRYQFAVNLV